MVTNLNADRLDGQDSGAFATQVGLGSEQNVRASADQNLQSSLDSFSALALRCLLG